MFYNKLGNIKDTDEMLKYLDGISTDYYFILPITGPGFLVFHDDLVDLGSQFNFTTRTANNKRKVINFSLLNLNPDKKADIKLEEIFYSIEEDDRFIGYLTEYHKIIHFGNPNDNLVSEDILVLYGNEYL